MPYTRWPDETKKGFYMKLISVGIAMLLLTACFRDINALDYQEVVTKPLPHQETLTVVDEAPLDVTHTRISRY
tara:strand:- start:4847 stop:5065 length:219 start_codon:yes stop_codon:yes gene_type:complete